jgi:hypothetical protein
MGARIEQMSKAILAVVFVLAVACQLLGQQLQIGIIDCYGLNRLSQADVRQALTFKEGDSISLGDGARPLFFAESESRLSRLPGVSQPRTNVVCCDAKLLPP